MTPDEHAHVQELEGKVKRYRSRIVALKTEHEAEVIRLREQLASESKAYADAIARYDDLLLGLRAHLARAEALIAWALGEHPTDAFPDLPDDWPARKFYWRKELRQRLAAAELPAQTGTPE